MTGARKLIVPGLLAFALFNLLVSLGVWQLNRMAWKQRQIAQIETRAKAPPLELIDITPAMRDPASAPALDFSRVKATGAFDHSRELHLIAPQRQGAGWMVITRFDMADGPVLVMRGVAPDELRDPARRPDGQVGGQITIEGRIRAGEQAGWLTPANDVARNAWFWRDLAGMQRAAGFDLSNRTLPFFIELESPVPPGGLPRPQLDAINLRNDHLQYAITWFALSIVLIVMFFVWARSQLKKDAAT
ncbi:MAG: SURF1 family protein [Beijerinckiaceae bacterium]